MTQLTCNLIDLFQRRIYAAELQLDETRIARIRPLADSEQSDLPYALPGFVDAHVHIESSMLIPSEFARMAVVHGTVATISDPHEIANVLGTEGVLYMIRNGAEVPFHFCFGAPSCVPATPFETAGAVLNAPEVASLLDLPEIGYLSEMMNFPGVLQGDAEVLSKIQAARQRGKPVDGHAPGLRGEAARRYFAAGISTDHECFSYEEGLEKLQLGVHILIREGSAARNFDALIDLLDRYPERIMFCSDDKHPDSLLEGHINLLVRRALRHGLPLFDVLRAACLNPVLQYHLPVGLLREGDSADFVLVNNLEDWSIRSTYIQGTLVAHQGKSLMARVAATSPNRFQPTQLQEQDLQIPCLRPGADIRVIEVLEGQLMTGELRMPPSLREGLLASDPDRDLLKLVLVNRYQPAPPALAFIKNMGLRQGAIASSVAHDSHNLIAVGADDASLLRSLQLLMEARGGISAVGPGFQEVLPLPVAGLMSTEDGFEVARSYARMDALAKKLGSPLGAPFMTLSFMALLVIPALKLSDRGLFDAGRYAFCSLEV